MHKNNPQENSADNDSSNSEEYGDGRFDVDDPFKDMECTNVYIDEDERDRLPDFFNLKTVKHIKRDDCYLCHEQVGGKMQFKERKKMYCSYCGQTVCKYCCQNRRALSKADPKLFPVCDMCDHTLSNMLFKESVKQDIERKKIACEELTLGTKMLDSKIEKLAKLKKEQARIYQKRQQDIQMQETHYMQLSKEQRQKNKQLEQSNKDSELKLEEIDDIIESRKQLLKEKKEYLDEIKQKQTQIVQKIEETEINREHNYSVIRLHMTEEYEGQFKKQEIQEVDIDPRLVKNWRQNDDSQTLEDNTVEMSLDMDLDAYRTNDSQALPNTQSNKNSQFEGIDSANAFELHNNNKQKSGSQFTKRPKVSKKE